MSDYLLLARRIHAALYRRFGSLPEGTWEEIMDVVEGFEREQADARPPR